MQFDLPDLAQTIIAVSSPVGAGRRSIVRLTGKDVFDFGFAIFGKSFEKYAAASKRIAGREMLDFTGWTSVNALILLMPAPKSYTREDVLEIHLPASQPLVEMILQDALSQGVRMAAPGEFTLRAFVNGRISAYEVENISRLIEARNSHEARASASRINSKIISELFEIEDMLIKIVSRLELSIDFEEDEHDEIDFSSLKQNLRECEAKLGKILKKTEASIVSGLPVVAIAGPVNAGKSSLFNLMTGAEDAIISAREKTTRDFIIGEIELNKIKVSLVDTAGYFDDVKDNMIDVASKKKAQEIVNSASLVLWCAEDLAGIKNGITLLAQLRIDNSRIIFCKTKSDLRQTYPLKPDNAKVEHIQISVRTGQNINLLRDKIEKLLKTERASDLISISAREKSILNQTQQGLSELINSKVSYDNLETFTEDQKTVLRIVGKMTGTSLEAETLSNLFSDFCIGK